MTKENIKLRAHHGMCLAFFEGKGYNEGFSNHMQSVFYKMQDNPKLQVIAEADLICSKCPNLKNGRCNTPELVQKYDTQVLALCGLTKNSELTWNEFSTLIAERILSQGKRETICGNCEWTEICKAKEQILNGD